MECFLGQIKALAHPCMHSSHRDHFSYSSFLKGELVHLPPGSDICKAWEVWGGGKGVLDSCLVRTLGVFYSPGQKVW